MVDAQESMAGRIVKGVGILRVRLHVSSIDEDNLPNIIQIPRIDDKGVIQQRVEYGGLPGQCFICRKWDHLAKDCSRNKKKIVDGP